jgi:hypothetical protein
MILVTLSVAVVLAGPSGSVATEVHLVDVLVTHSHLKPVCLDGEAAKAGERNWRLHPGQHSMVFTMRNDPREGAEPHQRIVPKTVPGFAAVSFTLEAGHKYEIEVRASEIAFSTRAWEREDWKPVVRDRTADRVVSGEANWDGSPLNAVLCPTKRGLARKVLEFRAHHSLRNGTLAHRMQQRFVEAGLEDASVEERTLVVRDPTSVDNVMGLRYWARTALAQRIMSDADVHRGETLYDDVVAEGRFCWSVSFFITSGRKA